MKIMGCNFCTTEMNSFAQRLEGQRGKRCFFSRINMTTLKNPQDYLDLSGQKSPQMCT